MDLGSFSTPLTWLGILICIGQSAMFSGLNLAMFGVSRLSLEVEAETGNKAAKRLLELRQQSNFLLATILWGNVASNVLLTLLSDSMLAGVSAFLFSTFVITFLGEIMPQAYFSRNALRMAALLAPVLRFYQFLLYPITKPTAIMLDNWLGHEGIEFFREKGLTAVIRKHVEAEETDLGHAEGLGAMNFLELDDLPVSDEGQPVDPDSVISLPVNLDLPMIPEVAVNPDDEFLRRVEHSGKKWVVLTNPAGHPLLVLDSDAYLRAAFFRKGRFNPYHYCHRPILIENDRTRLGKVFWKLKVFPQTAEDDVIDQDIILVWGATRRIITGADILGRLMRGIATPQGGVSEPPHSAG